MTFLDNKAKCPFYCSSRKYTIYCEGVITKYCGNTFGSLAKFKEYATEKCCDNYESCEHYNAVMFAKYMEV